MMRLRPATLCRWFGHKRRSLDGDNENVCIRNVDACGRCGCFLIADRHWSFILKP